MNNLPVGTATFLFTDIEGSTQLWEKHPEEMKAALAKHDSTMKEAIEENHGLIIKRTGDGFHAVFSTAIDAVHASCKAQRSLLSFFAQPTVPFSIKVRMGLHTGEAELRDGDYYGQALNRAARIMTSGHGGQVLISSTTADLVHEHLPPTLSLLDLGEHHFKGLLNAERIYQLCAPDFQNEFPALNSIATATHNLPTQLTSFIGRDRERGEVNEKLKSTRLLTLIGPGGTGKTRLSLQVAEDHLLEYKDGVWFVELASLADPKLILQSIASVFNVRAQQGMPLQDIITNYLRAKNLLLILDNCEHVIEACAQLVDQILRTSSQVKIMISSREALGINGETVYRVPSLKLPDQDKVAIDTLMRCESAQLFAERARAANPKFELNDKSASAIAQICLRLDGIPLALELAAARSTLFSAEQIAARLDDRFKLLTGGSRTALPRQQTLRALIDWSYDILPDEERTLLRRLSVFAGGWTFEAAEAICPKLDVLNLLTQLINKSLVTVDDGVMTRYRLLETIRQYARDKLLDTGESEQVRHLHLNYFVDFAEQGAPGINTQESIQWIQSLDVEHDNFRAAFDWGLSQNPERCLQLIGDIAYYWFRRGHGAEAIEMANAALARADSLPKSSNESTSRQSMLTRARALQAASFLSYSQGDNMNAVKTGSECIALARQLGDDRILAMGLSFSGSAKLFAGDFSDAAAQIEEAIAISRKAGEKLGLGVALGMMAQAKMIIDHDLNAGQAYEDEALLLTSENGNSWSRLMLYFSTARGAMFRGDYATARERFAMCLPMFQEMKDEHRENMIHSEFAHMDRYEGKYEQAEEAYRKTILAWEKLGHRAAIAHQLESFAFIALAQRRLERAACLFGAAEKLRETINIKMSPPEQVEYNKAVGELRSAMDEKIFSSNWADGKTMSMEKAVTFAIK